MTAAQMRKMMQGVVLYGSGKPAAAQRLLLPAARPAPRKRSIQERIFIPRPCTSRRLSGIAPVNNPVDRDSRGHRQPQKGPSYYGTAVSAPVFAEVAQEVLEYLGVPHDTTLVAPTDLAKATCGSSRSNEDAPSEHSRRSRSALFAEVNNLPADDPLRSEVNGQQPVPSAANELASELADAAAALRHRIPVLRVAACIRACTR